jgi:hypothetical protein
MKTSYLGKGRENVKTFFILSAPNDLTKNLIWYCTRALNGPYSTTESIQSNRAVSYLIV